MEMKQLDFQEKKIGDNTFYIRPLPAFKAANISGEVAGFLMPVIGTLAPLITSEKGVQDMTLEEAAPTISNAFSALSGAKVEGLLKKLLLDGKNISFVTPENDKPEILTESIANELFCANVQEMFMLAFEVIRTNYGGFFAKLSSQSGKAMSLLKTLESGKNTASST